MNESEDIKHYRADIARLLREHKNSQSSIVILIEADTEEKKVNMIESLIKDLDPRDYMLYAGEDKGAALGKPVLYEFAINLPEKGRITIFDNNWYENLKVLYEESLNYQDLAADISNFENLVINNGIMLMKLYAYSSKDDFDIVKLPDYLVNHNENTAPWYIVKDELEMFSYIYNRLQLSPDADTVEPVGELMLTMPKELLSYEEYKDRLKNVKEELGVLSKKIDFYGLSAVILFEGQDASGKGGTIKRLINALDHRTYMVYPISAPNEIEKNHLYLWRFYKAIPPRGRIAIFDRSWYGRVLVEPIEGFCNISECNRAYDEINSFERQLINSDVLLIKFYLNIDKDEQGRRFEERSNNPEKEWKITQEDWRNREKWDEYVKMTGKMLQRTSTKNAPWHVIPGDDKHYARITILEKIVEILEGRIDEYEHKLSKRIRKNISKD